MKTLRKIFICIFGSAALLGAVVACLGAAAGLVLVMSCYSSERVQAAGIEKILPENEGRLVKVHGWLELTGRPQKTQWGSLVISKGTLGAYQVVAGLNLSDAPCHNVSLPSSSGEVWLMGRQRGETLHVEHRFSGSHLAWHLCTHGGAILDWNYISAGFFLAWALVSLLVAHVGLLLGWVFLTYAYPWARGAPPAWLRLRSLALRLFTLLPAFYVGCSAYLSMDGFHYEWNKALLFFLIATLPLAAWLWSYRRNRIVNNSSK